MPFAYLGGLIDDGKTIVFLAREDRNYVVRLGDTIDGTYRVEEISERGMTLTYLPLGLRQSLAIDGAPLAAQTPIASFAHVSPVPTSPAATAVPQSDPKKLVWIAPPKVAIGEDFTIKVGLPAGPEPRSGRVGLIYDARVLAVLGGATPAPSSSGVTARRAIVAVIGPGFPGAPPTPSEVRFRVLAAGPTSTEIGIENISAITSAGSPLLLSTSPAHQLAIVQPQRSRTESD